MRFLSIIIAGIFFIGVLLFFSIQRASKPVNNTLTNEPRTESPSIKEGSGSLTVILTGLEIPWETAFDKSGNLFISERPGRILFLKKGDSKAQEIARISDVLHLGEGGLLGLTLHPDFSQNNFIYIYYTYRSKGEVFNKVVRLRKSGDSLVDQKVIIEKIPGAANHNGGRIKFGPDGLLYVTTGDAGSEDRAQDKKSLAGKILRVRDDGTIPEDNPFGNQVFSYGHRNPQGLAWDSQGRLFSTEHGRSGVKSGLDELNLIEKGKNYGWPRIEGDESQAGLESPKIHSGPLTTWAPAGAVFFEDSIFFTGLRGQTLYQAKISGSGIELVSHFQGQFGRLRNITLGPEGFFYLATSNRDGRGTPKEGDDKIIRLSPRSLKSR